MSLYKKIKLYDYNNSDLSLEVHVSDFDTFSFLTLTSEFTDIKKLTSDLVNSATGVVKAILPKPVKKFIPNSKTASKGLQQAVTIYGGGLNVAIGGTGAITKQFYTGSNIDFPLRLGFKLISDENSTATEKMDLLSYWSLPKKNMKAVTDEQKKALDKVNSILDTGFTEIDALSNSITSKLGIDKSQLDWFQWAPSWLGLKIDDVFTLEKPPLVINNIEFKPSFESCDEKGNPREITVNILLQFLQVPTHSEFIQFHNIVADLGKLEDDYIDNMRAFPENSTNDSNVDSYVNCELGKYASVEEINDGGE